MHFANDLRVENLDWLRIPLAFAAIAPLLGQLSFVDVARLHGELKPMMPSYSMICSAKEDWKVLKSICASENKETVTALH